ncbi:MAG: MMPL family transporter [Bdellovibrionota bacterium]
MLLRYLLYFILILNFSLGLFCASFEKFPSTSGDAKDLFPYHSESLTRLKEIENTFGPGIYDTIVIEATQNNLFELEEIEASLESLSGIEEIVSPVNVSVEGYSKGFYVKNSQNDLGRFLLKMNTSLNDAERINLNNLINETIYEYPNLNPKRSGSFYITESLTSAIESETSKLVPFTALVLFIVCFLICRCLKVTLVVMATPALALLTVTLICALLNVPLGPVSQLAPPFIISIAAAYSIHVANHILKKGDFSKEIFTSIFLAAITTSIGLFSLIFLDVRGVTEFALISGSGNLLAALYSFAFPANFLSINCARKLKAIYVPSKPLRNNVFLSLILLTFFTAWGVSKIQIDTNPVSFLEKRSESLANVQAVEQAFPGNRFISLVFKKENGQALSDSEIMSFSWLNSELIKLNFIRSVVDPTKLKEKIERLSNLNVQDFSLLSDKELDDQVNFLISPDKSLIRFIIETDVDGTRLIELENQIISILDSKNLASYNYFLGAFELVMAKQSNKITSGILNSLLCTLLIVAAILFYLTRSLKVTLIGLVPNIIPLLTVFGMIGWLFQEINLGAALVATAALGIAVDNTFHFIINWKKNLSLMNNSEAASEATLKELFEPFIFTTLILSAGFSVLLLAKVEPTFQFGLLLITTLWCGLLADTSVLPSLLSKIYKEAT